MRIYSIAKQHAACLALAAIGLMTLSDVATAQQTDEVTVTAPREITRTNAARLNAPREVVSISEEVSYKDLDLKKPEDAAELNKRVNAAAEDSCSELDRLVPITKSGRLQRECVRNAVQAATTQINTAVASSAK